MHIGHCHTHYKTEYIFLLGDKRVYRRGIQTRKNFYFRDRTFPFRDRREEGMMSNRAERLSDRAKRGSDSVARLDSPSDWRSRKGNSQGNKSSSKFVLSSTGHIIVLKGDTFSCSVTICPTISLLI